MKATTVAILYFHARNPSSVSEADSLRHDAEAIQAYPVSSKRHVAGNISSVYKHSL